MKNISILIFLTIFTSTTFCMHSTRRTLNRTFSTQTTTFTPESTESTIYTLAHFNPAEGRREAYQKYCPTPIIWDQPAHKQAPTMELKPNSSEKNDFGYWNQYTKK